MLRAFRLDAAANTLWTADGPVTLGHHQAGRFLGALVLQARLGQDLSAAAVSAHWAGRVDGAAPDRTAIRRVLRAVQKALEAAGSESRIIIQPRQTTVGPWRFRLAASEHWELIEPAPESRKMRVAPADGGPRLTSISEPRTLLAAISMVAIADDLARQAQYREAADYVIDQIPSLPLTHEALALLALRRARWLRRGGQMEQAKSALEQAFASSRKANVHAKAHLLADCSVQSARLAYDENPMGQAARISFTKLDQQVNVTGSVQLRWELANLQALVCRRKLQKMLARNNKADVPRLGDLVQLAEQSFAKALFWLTVACDAYHLQAVLVNYAYHLQWLVQQNIHLDHAPLMTEVVEAWRLSHTITERFDLPEDSAWDYIMLADLWLHHPEARHLVRTDARLWPKERSPADPDFYHRGVELAHNSGSTRQQILALDRCTAFFVANGNAKLAADTRNRRDMLLATDAELARHLSQEGLWAGSIPKFKRSSDG